MSLNLALVISGDATGAKRAAQDTTAAVRETGAASTQAAAAIRAANDQSIASAQRVVQALTGQTAAQRQLWQATQAMVARGTPTDDATYRQRGADIAAYGAALDQLRARYNPLFAAEQNHLRNLAEIDRALKVGAISEAEHANAVRAAALAYELQVAGLDRVAGAALAAKLQLEEYSRQAAVARQQQAADQAQTRVNQLLGVRDPSAFAGNARASAETFLAFPDAKEGAKNVALASHEMANLTFQMNDVAMMLASGQSPFILMMQQGSQISQILGQRGLGQILPAIGSALKNLVSPTTLLLAGVTAAGYAAYAAYRAVVPEVRQLDDILDRHKDLVDRLKQSYADATDAAKRYGRESQLVLMSQARSENDEMTKRLQSQARGIYSDTMGDAARFLDLPQLLPKALVGRSSTLGPIYDAVLKLNDEAKRGVPDFRAFQIELAAIGDNPAFSGGIRKKAEELRDFVDEMVKGQLQLQQFEEAKRRFETSFGPGGIPLRRGPLSTEDTGAYSQYLAAQKVDIERQQQAFDAQRQSLYARSPAEIAAAARANESSQYNDNEDPAARTRRINMAGQMAQLQAQHQLDEAQTERKRSLDAVLASQQLDLSLIGKTAAEADGLRMAWQLEQEVRQEAARNNIKVDDAEIARIREKAREFAKYADAIARANLARDLQFERDQLGRSDIEQRVASRLQGAGLEVDLNSQAAQQIRVNEVLKEQVDLWKDIRKAGMDAYSDIFDLAFDGFDNWEDRLSDIAKDMAKNLFDLSFKNPFLNEKYGSDLPTLDKAGGLGGWIGTLLGMTPNPASGLGELGTMANPMYVVPVGGLGGEGGILGTVSRLFSPANDNTAGAVAKTAAATLLPAGAGGVGAQLWNFFAGKGLQPHMIAGILGNLNAESGLNPSAVNPNGGAFGLAQWLGSRKTALGAGAGLGRQMDFLWQELQGSERGVLQKLLASTDVRSATGAFAGFERAEGWSKGNPEGIALWGKRLSGAEQALARFGGAAGSATQNLGDFGKGLEAGLGDLGKGLGGLWKNLGSFLQSSSGGGSSWFQGLASAFGGVGGAFGHMLSISPAATMNIVSGSWGAYASGTEGAPPGWAWIGEEGPELMRMRGGEVIRSNPRSVQMVADAARASGAPSKVENHFHNAPPVVREEETDDGHGGRRMDIWFEQQVAKASTRRGSAASKALAGMNVTRSGKLR